MLLWALVAVLLIGAVAFIVVIAWRARRMGAALPAVMAGIGLRFESPDPFDTLSSGFALFGRGRRRRIPHVSHGSYQGREVRLLGYFTQVGRGRRGKAYVLIGALVEMNAPGVDFRVEPYGRYGAFRPKEAKASLEIGDERFEHEWLIRGADADAVRAVLSPRLRQLLDGDADRPYLERRGGWLLVAAMTRRPERWPAFADAAIGWVERLAADPAERLAGEPAERFTLDPTETVVSRWRAGQLEDAVALLPAVPRGVAAPDDPDVALASAICATLADRLASSDPARAQRLYEQALDAQRSFASAATSGGEGRARSAGADDLAAKLAGLG